MRPMIALVNPLRSLAGDVAHLTDLVKTIDGPLVLADHSYGRADHQRSGRGRRYRRPCLPRSIRA